MQKPVQPMESCRILSDGQAEGLFIPVRVLAAFSSPGHPSPYTLPYLRKEVWTDSCGRREPLLLKP